MSGPGMGARRPPPGGFRGPGGPGGPGGFTEHGRREAEGLPRRLLPPARSAFDRRLPGSSSSSSSPWSACRSSSSARGCSARRRTSCSRVSSASQLPAGMTQAQAEAALRAAGQDQLADMLSGMTVTPGVGVDFSELGRHPRHRRGDLHHQRGLLAGARRTSWPESRSGPSTASARTSTRSSSRLPLKYFDDHPRGDILSRVTNDIDNISQTLQQTLTQLITAVLTLIGILLMMFLISPLLARRSRC